MQIQTPDIGVDKALVAEVLVKVGDQIEQIGRASCRERV